MTKLCTTCTAPLHGTGLKIGAQVLCVWCGESWTLPVYPMFVNGRQVSLEQIVADREREQERREAA